MKRIIKLYRENGEYFFHNCRTWKVNLEDPGMTTFIQHDCKNPDGDRRLCLLVPMQIIKSLFGTVQSFVSAMTYSNDGIVYEQWDDDELVYRHLYVQPENYLVKNKRQYGEIGPVFVEINVLYKFVYLNANLEG